MSKEITFKTSDIRDLLEELQRDFNAVDKDPALLAKAEDDKEPKKEEKKEPPKDDAEPSESPAAEIAPDEDMPEDAGADEAPPASAQDPVDDSALTSPDEVSPEASMEAPDDGMGMDQAIEPAPSIEALQAEYEQLPEHELMMHLCAAHAACLARGGLAAAPPAPMAPEAEMAPPMAVDAPAMPPAMKGELEMQPKNEDKGNDGNGDTFKKSEEYRSLTAKIAEQDKALAELVNFVTTPIRKSIKNISEVKFMERGTEDKAPLSQAEVHAKLKTLTDPSNTDLKKSDRDLINKFYSKSITVDKLEHLLKG